MGEQPDGAGGAVPNPVGDQAARRILERLARVAEEVRRAKPRGGRTTGRPEGELVEDLGQLRQVEQRHEDAIAEPVLDRAQPAVHHPPLVDRGLPAHAASACAAACTPSDSATRRADQTPSSWKPQRQYAPQ